MNKKLSISIVAILVIVVASIMWWQGSPSQPQKYTGPVEKVTVGSYTGEYAALFYIADEKGYFKDEGIDLEIKPYQGGIFAIPDLVAGKIDIVLANEFAPVLKTFDTPNLKILASINKTNSYEFIALRDHGINVPADLKGKKVGIPKNTQSEFLLGTFLTFNHLSLTDLEVIYITPLDLMDAMVSGKIDATVIWPPHSFNIAKKLGTNAVVWGGQSDQDVYFVLVGSDDLVKKGPRVIEKVLRALIKAEEFVKNNTAETKVIVMGRTKTDEAYIKHVWSQNSFSVSLEQAMVLTMEDEARWMIENKLTDKTKVPNYLDLIYFDALEKVKPEAVTIIH